MLRNQEKIHLLEEYS